MFDNFESYKSVSKQNFSFHPSRFEMWIGGEMVRDGATNQSINAKPVIIDNVQKMEITFNDVSLSNELAQNNIFDEFVTANDRLQLLILPAKTNVENTGIMFLKMILGATREIKNFNRNEPFCCNLFLQKGIIVKVTFSYSNPEKLLEFYK